MHNIINCIQKLLLRLPLGFCFWIGKTVGLLLYANRKKRFIAFRNLKLVFPQKSSKELRVIMRRSFEYFGLSLIETLIARRLYENNKIEIKGNFPDKGSILIGVHAGSWELINISFAQKQDFSVLVKPQKGKKLDDKLNDLRKDNGLDISLTLKELIRKLKNGTTIGMVVDQGAEDNPLLIDFFSHPVPTPQGAVYLARRFGRKIYPCFGYRTGKFRHILEIGASLKLDKNDNAGVLRDINAIYEGHIKAHPSEYFWWYKRFKRRADRDVLILSDEKLGHLKQARSLFMFLAENSKYALRKREVVVRYKNNFCRSLADLCASFSGKFCLGCGRCMYTVLDSRTGSQLKGVYADLVISSGSFSAPVNKLFSSCIGAKSVTILRSNFPLNRFTYAFIPYHDRLQGKNIINFTGSLFYPQGVAGKAEACKMHFNMKPGKKISFFLGGPLANTLEFMSGLKSFTAVLKKYASKNGFSLLLSTSRRTPEEARDFLKQEFLDFSNTAALVIAAEENYDFIFEGFCGLSDIIFVSSESISMVSEISSINPACVAVSLESQDDKRSVFFDSIKNDVALLARPYDINTIDLRKSGIFQKNKEAVKKVTSALF